MRLCGPNCLGLINAFERVIATFSQFADGATPAGPVGFVTQSGAFGTAIAALARRRELGLGYFVNTGNESDVTFAQVMREVIADPRIRVGAGYIEGLRDGGEMMALAEFALDAGKPLVLVKVGRSNAGARAAASHTGSSRGRRCGLRPRRSASTASSARATKSRCSTWSRCSPAANCRRAAASAS